jgi:tetratricopeptide (TPR) repeat protein
MLELTPPHLDDFTLLRYVAEDLNVGERAVAAHHVEACRVCQKTVAELQQLDEELKTISSSPETQLDFELEELPQGDPFRHRPMVNVKNPGGTKDRESFAARAVSASEEGCALSSVILEAGKTSSSELPEVLNRLDLSDLAQRFALLYALQEAGRQIGEAPARAFTLAEKSLERLFESGRNASEVSDPEPSAGALLGQAHQLAGQACLWTGEFVKAGSHLALAYQFFGQEKDTVGLAVTEFLESQRRSFTNNGGQGLTLIRRALIVFERLGLDDYVARAEVAQGLALVDLGRYEEAIRAYRRALPVFERRQLWGNFVGGVNSIGTSLVKLGRLGEARREYARALRRFSAEHHRSWMGFIREGLAQVLLTADRPRDAAVSMAQAARAFGASGLLLHQFRAALSEIEAWARAGDAERARRRFVIFREEVSRVGGLDPAISRDIESALAGDRPDLLRVSELRKRACSRLDERLGRRYA